MIYTIFFYLFGQGSLGAHLLVRVQHGAAYVTDDTAEISGYKILRVMVRNIWPKDQPALKARVLVAVGLLFGSKAS